MLKSTFLTTFNKHFQESIIVIKLCFSYVNVSSIDNII